jgi:hypothetical protein
MNRNRQAVFLVGVKFPYYSIGIHTYVVATCIRLHCERDSDKLIQSLWNRFREFIAEMIEADPSELTPAGVEEIRKFLIETGEYYGSLKELPEADFVELYRKEKLGSQGRTEERGVESDKWRFFNEPEADANFEHWAACAAWTPNEAVALSLGKEPSVVNLPAIGRMIGRGDSPFVRTFKQRSQMVLRAIAAGDLEKPLLPSAFLEWTKNVGLPLPPRLIELVGPNLTVWKDRCYELREEMEALKSELEHFRGQDLSTNERRSLLKMVLAMAVAKFEYSRRIRTPAAKLIARVSQLYPELTFSEDTAKKWLDQAASELDFQLADEI